MARPVPAEELTAIVDIVRRHPDGVGLQDIVAALPDDVPVRSLTRSGSSIVTLYAPSWQKSSAPAWTGKRLPRISRHGRTRISRLQTVSDSGRSSRPSFSACMKGILRATSSGRRSSPLGGKVGKEGRNGRVTEANTSACRLLHRPCSSPRTASSCGPAPAAGSNVPPRCCRSQAGHHRDKRQGAQAPHPHRQRRASGRHPGSWRGSWRPYPGPRRGAAVAGLCPLGLPLAASCLRRRRLCRTEAQGRPRQGVPGSVLRQAASAGRTRSAISLPRSRSTTAISY